MSDHATTVPHAVMQDAVSSPTTLTTVHSLQGTQPQPLKRALSKQQACRAEMESGRKDYTSYMHRLHSLWTDVIELTISYSDLAYDIPVPVTDPGIPNLLKSLYSAFTLQAWRTPHKSFLALQPSSGLMLPGRMTLVLAPPGHGKSTLLKALAGRFHGDSRLRGEVRYSGMTCQQAQQHGLHVHKLTAYVDQGDCHLAQLTVRETLQFALDNSVSDPALLQDEQFARLSAAKVDLMLDLLGLREAEHTILGNAVLRGVSGGQRRRVTIGEMMITNARAVFLDEITTGLDSATSFDILHALRQWTRVMSGSTMVALLQPTPECFELFDQLILLRQGAVVYDGPIGGVREYLQSIGVPVPDDQDLAHYLSDFLTDPAAVYQRTTYRAAPKAKLNQEVAMRSSEEEKVGEGRKAAERSSAPPCYDVATPTAESTSEASVDTGDGECRANGLSGSTDGSQTAEDSLRGIHGRSAPLTTSSLVSAFRSSTYYQETTAAQRKHATSVSRIDRAQLTSYSRAQFGQPYGRSFLELLATNLSRSGRIMRRNKGFWMPRIFQATFLGCILGGLFYQLPAGAFQARLGLCLFAAVNMGFTNAAEVPFAGEGKGVVFKQQDAGFYSAASYLWSVIIVHLPLSVVESCVFSLLIYFLCGFVYDAGRYFFFALTLWLTNITLSCVFRTLTHATRSTDVANMLASPTVATFMLFGGYLILQNNIPRWLVWMFWISPFSWTLRSLAINEFYADRYSAPFEVSGSDFEGYRTGEAYLRLFDIDPTWAYKWAGLGYLVALFPRPDGTQHTGARSRPLSAHYGH